MFCCCCSVLFYFGVISEFLVRRLPEHSISLEVRDQLPVGFRDVLKGNFYKISLDLCADFVWHAAVINPGHQQQLLVLRIRENASASGCSNDSHHHSTTVVSHLSQTAVGLVNLSPKVVLLHRDDGNLGQVDGPWNGSVFLLRALNTKIKMAIVVHISDKGLETDPLAFALAWCLGAPLSEMHPGKKSIISKYFKDRKNRLISSTNLIFLSWPLWGWGPHSLLLALLPLAPWLLPQL